jgi:ATP-binding cassette subfamily F protein uup
MLEPADVLMLDEPTNDLDIPTLEVLEESLLEFPGALVLVTHDRYLLDRVSTKLLALDGQGGVVAYADYPQWEQTRSDVQSVATASGVGTATRSAATAPGSATGTKRAAASTERPKRLSYLEQREWEQIEARIQEAEGLRDTHATEAADPAIAADHSTLAARHAALDAAQNEVDRLYARWAELESKRNA